MKGEPPKSVTPKLRHRAQESLPMGESDKAIAILLVSLGFQHKRIAALFDVNQGRIAEIVRGVSSVVRLEK